MNKTIVKILILLSLALPAFLSVSCQTSKYKSFSVIKKNDVMNMEYEIFDMEYFEKKKTYSGKIYDSYTKEDGTQVEVWGKIGDGFTIFEYPPTPYFYTKYKSFYGDGRLKEKGVFLSSNCYIGKWMECDEEGNCKIVDYDKNMGRFDYNDVLKFLNKLGYIDLKTGEGKDNFTMGYSYEQKHWIVEATKDRVYWTKYILDGNSGKILKEELLPVKH